MIEALDQRRGYLHDDHPEDVTIFEAGIALLGAGRNYRSMTIKAGMVERLKIKVAATAIGAAGAMVASRVAATAPRIAAIGPCAQLARFQNPLTKKTVSAAHTPIHSAPTGSFAWVKRIGREALLDAEVKAS
jgi:hypothetical protein